MTSTPPSPPRPRGKPWARAVLHVDMDAFYASVEQRDRPALAGKPVIVGGTGRRGVVSTASYEARKFGVKSAMASVVAQRLCPHGIFVPPRMGRYVEVSRQVMAILSRFSPTIEPLSLDEAFLDATGTDELFGPPVELAWRIQRAVKDEVQLSCAVGAAANKYVAKVASDVKKPGGIVVVNPGEEQAFLAPLPVERLWGVGPKTGERLRADGFATIADVAAADAVDLQRRYGSLGAHLHALAHGRDDRPVDDDHERKSLGAERTLDADITGAAEVRRQLLPLIDEVAAGLRRAGLRAGGVRLKVKYADFHRTSREHLLAEPAQDSASLLSTLEQLLPRVDLSRPMRLVGLAATHLQPADAPRQVSLFDAPQTTKSEALGRALDAIHARHGKNAVTRGEVRDGERLDRGNEHRTAGLFESDDDDDAHDHES
jgi:DNA polymerase-4